MDAGSVAMTGVDRIPLGTWLTNSEDPTLKDLKLSLWTNLCDNDEWTERLS